MRGAVVPQVHGYDGQFGDGQSPRVLCAEQSHVSLRSGVKINLHPGSNVRGGFVPPGEESLYNIVVIEDHHETGTLLRTYIDNELERLVTVPRALSTVDEPPRNPKTGDRFEDACNEPGQGQLVHLRHLIEHLEMERDDPENEIPDIIVPTARLFPLDALSHLCQVAEAFEPNYGHKIEEDRDECRDLRTVVDRFCAPDIIVADLAMNADEAGRMIEAGGLDTFNANDPHSLADPREVLRTLTGFKLLRAYARSVPFIVTATWPNPLVAQHCLVNGAFAYVHKPVLTTAENQVDFLHASEIGTTAMDKAAKTNKSPLEVVVVHYLTDAVTEVLKAMNARWISSLR
jgi:CheY-like chemotaxis protein